MKKITFTFLLVICLNACINAQIISTFEVPVLPLSSSWNGSDGSGGFFNGNAFFTNKFTDWGGGITSWSGFAYTNMNDTVTQSFLNEFSSVTGAGFQNSIQYAVSYVSAFEPLPRIKVNGIADTVGGFYITNSAYSYLTMKNGGGLAKKFGGTSGTDPDWFLLVVYGYRNGFKISDSVEFYLADFRFSNSSQDYIVKDWQWLSLTTLGAVDSLEFNLFSSDTAGGFGINNPTYFCMDNLFTNFSHIGMDEKEENSLKIYPNPAVDYLFFENFSDFKLAQIYSFSGQLISEAQINNGFVDVSRLKKGMYFVKFISDRLSKSTKFIKN